ncbi:MAG: hypothetical protein ACFFD4_13755 [Candidatus Odinarchaeota archaeon]
MILTIFKTSSLGPVGSIIYDADKDASIGTMSDLAHQLSFLAAMSFGLVFPSNIVDINERQEIIGPFPVKKTLSSSKVFYAFPFRAYDETYMDKRMNHISPCLLLILLPKKGDLRFRDGAKQILADSFSDLKKIQDIDIPFLRKIATALKPLEGEDITEPSIELLDVLQSRNILIVATKDLKDDMIRYVKRLIYLSAVTECSLDGNGAKICTSENFINLYLYWNSNDWYEELDRYHGILFITLGELRKDTRSQILNDLEQVLAKTGKEVPIGLYFQEKKQNSVKRLFDDARKTIGDEMMGRSFDIFPVESRTFIDKAISNGILWLTSMI